jgi:hypothetical protein
MTAAASQLRRIWEDPMEFILRLVILNEVNAEQRIGRLWEEQQSYIQALMTLKLIIALKPRQVGFTTIALAWFFWKTYTASTARRVLTTVHDEDAMTRAMDIVRLFHHGLPENLRCTLERDSRKSTKFSHNHGSMDRLKAGSRGQARGGTLNDWHGTEVAFYPPTSSATRSIESGTKADSDLVASIKAAMHDPEGQIVLESTGNGPSGPHYDMVRRAFETKDNRLVFVPWFAVSRYAADPPPGMEMELQPDELALIRDHGVNLRQLAWRRGKLTGPDAMTLARFRKEYPSTVLDPFRLESSGWFDADALNAMDAALPSHFRDLREDERIFYPPEEGRSYFIGVDSAGGVGLDEGGCSVMRDDQIEAACWASRWADVDEQAARVASLFALYRMGGKNRVVVLVEANKYGVEVIQRLERLGVRLWKDEDGKDWFSTGGNSGSSKRRLMVYCKAEVDGGRVQWNDPVALIQANNMVEKSNGRIECRISDGRRRGEADHDDRVLMRALALWCGKGHVHRARTVDPVAERARAIASFADQRGRRLPWT